LIRSTIARVDLHALKHNFAAIQAFLAGGEGASAPLVT